MFGYRPEDRPFRYLRLSPPPTPTMESVTVSRELATPPDVVEEAMADVGPFMEAAKFDEVDVDGDEVRIANGVGLATIELTLEVVEDPDATLVYEHREGIFEEMVTRYEVESIDGGSRVTATTDFALSAPFVGPILDATVIKRQRRVELNAQFDNLVELSA